MPQSIPGSHNLHGRKETHASSDVTSLWPNALRFAHPKTAVPFDWLENEAFTLVDAVTDALCFLLARKVPCICLILASYSPHIVKYKPV